MSEVASAGRSGSVASAVRRRVAATPPRTFLRVGDFDGDPGAVRAALGRLVAGGELLHVGRGLWWVGAKSFAGMVPPIPWSVAVALAGPGSGPAGLTAAHLLRLTTQVPSVKQVAVPGRPPTPPDGVVYHRRPRSRRTLGLGSVDVAVLEVLWDPYAAEQSWRWVVARLRELFDEGVADQAAIGAAVAAEDRRRRGLAERWASVLAGSAAREPPGMDR